MTTETELKDGNLIVTRIYHAAIIDVFDAWIETSKLKQWWGCAECTNVDSEVEAKVGGAYSHHMTVETPNGAVDVPGPGTLLEYDPPNRITYTSTDEADPMVVTVTFREVDTGTEVRLVHSNIPDMKVEGDIEMHEIIRGGWMAAFGKLAPVVEAAA